MYCLMSHPRHVMMICTVYTEMWPCRVSERDWAAGSGSQAAPCPGHWRAAELGALSVSEEAATGDRSYAWQLVLLLSWDSLTDITRMFDLYTFKTMARQSRYIIWLIPILLKSIDYFLATYSLYFCTISTQIDRYHTCLVGISVK